MTIMSLRRAVVLLACSTSSTRAPSVGALRVRNSFSGSAAATFSSSTADADTKGVDHVVLLRVKEGTTKSQIQKFKQGIQSLHTIPGVMSVSVGESFVEQWMADRRDGLTLGLCVRLESKEALQSYQDHELHNKVKEEYIAPIVESAVAIDWESPLILGTSNKK